MERASRRKDLLLLAVVLAIVQRRMGLGQIPWLRVVVIAGSIFLAFGEAEGVGFTPAPCGPRSR